MQSKKSLLFALYPEWGSVIPVTALAQIFSQRGWDVLFVFPTDDSEYSTIHNQQLKSYIEYVEQQGFQYQQLRPFPPQTKGLLANSRRTLEIGKNVLEDIVKIIQECHVGLVFIDSLISFISLAPIECGIPHVLIGTEFSGPIDTKIPPANSLLIPDKITLSKIRIRFAWIKSYLLFQFFSLVYPELFLYTYFGLNAFIRRKIKTLGVKSSFSENGTIINSSEIYYLMPQALDFAPRSGSQYLGCIVNLSRPERDSILDNLSGTRPLVYCSLGTRSWEYINSKKFFKIALATFYQQQNFEFVLNIGDACDEKDLGEIPPNVYICKWVSQIAVLRHSTMIITNGGMNTIKECIYFGVPMIVFPLEYDQFGNSARVVYHGLGVRGSAKQINSSKLANLINQIASSSSYLENIKKIQQKFLQSNESEIGIQRLESYLINS